MSQKNAPLLIAKDSVHESYAATMVAQKGVHPYSAAFLVGWIKRLGFKKIVLRSDNKPALLKLLDVVTTNLPGIEVVPKASPEGDSQANGFAEAAVREAKRWLR